MLHVFEEVDKGRYEVVSVAEEMGEKKESREETTGECRSCVVIHSTGMSAQQPFKYDIFL